MKNSQQSQNAIGRALGLSSATMSVYKSMGCPIEGGIDAVREWRRENVKPTMGKIDPSPPDEPTDSDASAGDRLADSYYTSKARREFAEAQISEMRAAELKGQLIRVDAVKAVWALKVSTTRDALLQIPSRLAPVLASESDLDRVTMLIECEIRQALVALSSGEPGEGLA